MEEEAKKDSNSGAPLGKPPLALRTLKTDTEEYFQKARPTLTQIIGKGLEQSKIKAEKEETKKYLILIAAAVVLIFLAGAATFWLIQKNNQTPAVKEIEPPMPFFAVEKTTAFAAKPGEPGEFLRSLNRTAKELQPAGTIKNILVKVEGPSGPRYLTFADFLNFLRIDPAPFLPSLAGESPMMLFSFMSSSGPRLGFAAMARDPERMIRVLISKEGNLQNDFQALLPEQNQALSTGRFEDLTFRNIDWRHLALDKEKDIGLGYALFPIRNIFVFTASREEMEAVINRLYLQ